MCVSVLWVCVCVCGPLANDHHISIQNLIAFLRSTLKVIQHDQQKEERLQSMNPGKQDKNNTGITLFSERFKGCLCSVSCHSAVRSEAINITMKRLILHHIPFCNRGKTENLLFTFSQHFPFWWKFVDPSYRVALSCKDQKLNFCLQNPHWSMLRSPAGCFRCRSKPHYKDPQYRRSAGKYFKEKYTAKCHESEKNRNKINNTMVFLSRAAGIINHEMVFVACPGGFCGRTFWLGI